MIESCLHDEEWMLSVEVMQGLSLAEKNDKPLL
jgi:hypothetical protein